MDPGLRELARLWGVQTSYVDGLGRRRRVPRESLLAVLRALDPPLASPGDMAEALRERRELPRRRPLEPVAVAWDGAGEIPLRSRRPDDLDRACTVRLEDGEERATRVRDRLTDLPAGYHRLSVDGLKGETLVVSAPRRAPSLEARAWGIFLPTYAIRREGDWGVGDLTGLAELTTWTDELGGSMVGTLPPLAAFLEEPFEPSPYAPASRRHWNELLVDVERAPELSRSEEAKRLAADRSAEIEALRRKSLVDHRRAMAVKRPVLEALARAFFEGPLPDVFHGFARGTDLDAYARFRAAVERHRAGWRAWPDPREGDNPDPERVDYHRYVQWLADAQLGDAGDLYLDLPLGVHRDGFDTWRHPELYPAGISTGAPADDFSAEGQDWGFPPMHPERLRELGHAPFIASTRALLRHARGLRIDHVMALHRLFWIPVGMPATAGAYVRMPHEELYAILLLEAHRSGAILVGEDLGTVHPEVRGELTRHGLHRMFVTQAEIRPDRDPPVRRVPRVAQASLNTHDMAPFRAFWEGTDIELRVEVGVLAPGKADEERAERTRVREALAAHLRGVGLLRPTDPTYEEALDAALAHLAGSDAALVMMSLEDLWGETAPQNVPGTTDRHPNWRRRIDRHLSEVRIMPSVLGRLTEVDRLRKGDR